MQLHTFRGSSMAQALLLVKQSLGKDAVIVNTRSFKLGGIAGVGAKSVVEITALAPAPTPVPSTPHPPTPDSPTSRPSSDARRPTASSVRFASPASTSRTPPHSPSLPSTSTQAPTIHTPPDPATPPPASPLIMHVRQRGALASSSATSLSPAHTRPPSSSSPIAPSTLQPSTASFPDDLRTELRDIRYLIHRLTPAHAPSVPTPDASALAQALPQSLFDQHLELLKQHVSRELADRIAADVRRELPPASLTSPDTVRDAILARLESLLPVSTTSVSPAKSPTAQPFSIALVGPTGVGKTTTIAKLAAAYKLHQDRSIALITTDTSRIGAIDQLAGYANVIGAPFAVAASPDDLVAAAAEFSHVDVLLIDTAGVPHRDSQRMASLSSLLSIVRPSETHLVLSGTMSEHAMHASAQAFAPAAPNRVLFTKLDEAVTFGVILSVAASLGTHLSFFTSGQNLTGDIEVPRPDRFARLLLPAA